MTGPETATFAEQTDELERTRGALRDSEERLRMLMANIPGAVYRRAAGSEHDDGSS